MCPKWTDLWRPGSTHPRSGMKRWRRPSVCHRGIAAACEGSRNQKISSEQSGIALKDQTVNPNAVGDTSGTDRLFAAAEYDP
jgi:hypothetical protein